MCIAVVRLVDCNWMGLVFTVTCHSGVAVLVRIVGDLNTQTQWCSNCGTDSG